jgi:hypothetical protein
MKEGFRKFKEMMMSEYPNILIKGIEENGIFNIYYFLDNFDIRDMQFHNFFGKSLNASFSEEEISNIASEFLFVEELEEYFPEIYDIFFKFSIEYNRKIEVSKKLKIKNTESFLPFNLEKGYKEYYEDTEMLMVA